MESLEFSEEEIRNQLAALGYFNVSEERMKQFRRDLHKLIEHDHSTSGSSSWYTGISSPSATSESSDTSDKIKSPQRPLLSRFQPHIKVLSKVAKTPNFRRGDSWMDQSDISGMPSNTDVPSYHTKPQRTDYLQTSTDGMRSLSLDEEEQTRAPLQQIQNQAHRPATTYYPSSKQDTPLVTEDYSSDSNTSTTTSTAAETKIVKKRKVLRKHLDGTPRVYDESLVEDPTRGLHRIHDISVDDSDPRLSRVAPRHHLPPRPHSTKPSWRKDSNFETFVTADQPPSYIRPNLSHPHTRNLRKTDPVNRQKDGEKRKLPKCVLQKDTTNLYRQYKDFWTNLKAPGEKPHKELRWEVKAQMMYKEEPAPKPQRVYVPNSYVVPTSKKRSALRWEVRHAMENGLPLPSTYDVY